MRYCFIIIMSFLLTVSPVQAEKKLIFSGLQNSKLGQMVEDVIKKAYQQIGITAETKWMPGVRALNVANNGEVDGAQLRVASIRKKFTNLIMIPIPVYETKIVAFTKNKKFSIQGWNDLKPYRIAVPAGYTAILDNVQGFNYWSVNYRQIFKMLDSDRVDIGVVDSFNGMVTISQLGIKGISSLEPPLKSIQFFNFLHKKHKNIVPQITQSLQQMQDEGKIQEIWAEFESKFARK